MACVSLFPWLLLTMLMVNTAICGPECPPGGKYLDRHLGLNGRWMCCSELCVPRAFQDQCRKKCPNYETDKLGNAEAVQPDPKAGNILHATNDLHPSSIAHYIIIPVAVVLIVIVAVVAKLGHWQGVSAMLVGYWTRIRPGGDRPAPDDFPATGSDQAPPELAVLPRQDAESTRPLLGENLSEELGDHTEGRSGMEEGQTGRADGRSTLADGRSERVPGNSGMAEGRSERVDGTSGPLDIGQPELVNEGALSQTDTAVNPPVYQRFVRPVQVEDNTETKTNFAL